MNIQLKLIKTKTGEYLFWSAITIYFLISIIFNPNLDSGYLKALLRVFFGGLGYLWFYQDSKQIEKITNQTRRFYFMPFLIVPELVSLYYVFHSRGFKKGMLSIFKFGLKLFAILIITLLINAILEKYGFIYT